MLAGCVTSGSAPLNRELPQKPAYAAPVVVPEPQEDEDARLVAARERAGRLENGRRLVALGKMWDRVTDRMAGRP